MKNIGEQEVTPQMTAQVAPDVASQQGQQQLQAKQVAAHKIKDVLDQALGIAADKLGGHASTRVKDLDTAQKKIAQKRLQGRTGYGVDDLNDILGGRLVVDKKNIPSAKQEIQKMSKSGLFQIKKEQQVKEGNYNGYHYDIVTPDGNKGELQIHTNSTEAESIANHDIRAKQGEDPSPQWQAIQDKQAQIIDSLSKKKAYAISQALQSLHQMNNNKPIAPEITAAVVKSQQQRKDWR
jgi:ppGpp synthetase/RelA/SpoT-type nucleotidyltranferase